MILAIERTSKLRSVGEQLAAECLEAAGYSKIKYLNRRTKKCPFADLLATRADGRFFIAVVSRNEFHASGELNTAYTVISVRQDMKRLLVREGKTDAEITASLWTEVYELADQWNATPAWTTVAMQLSSGTFSAFFGRVSQLGDRRSIPMSITDRRGYEVLAYQKEDARINTTLLTKR